MGRPKKIFDCRCVENEVNKNSPSQFVNRIYPTQFIGLYNSYHWFRAGSFVNLKRARVNGQLG